MSSSKRSWLLEEFSAHSTAVSAAALGKKSSRVMATGGEDGLVNLWAVGNPSYVMKFTGHSSSVTALTLNPSEELVCAGSHSGQLKIWNLSEGKVTRHLTGHKAAVTCLDFHSIGEFIASGSLDHKIKMWDYRRKGCIFTYTGHEGAINALQFSPDGRWMASASDDGFCKIWDLSAGKLLHQFGDHGAPVSCLQFHPSDLLIATGGKDKTVKVYDVERFHLVSSLKPQASAVLKVIFSESGHCVYSVSQDMCHAYLWEPQPCTTDSLIVKWGRPADVVISANQLISVAFTQNIVSNYIVDLAKVKTAPFELPTSVHPFQPPPTVTPFAPPSKVIQRASGPSRSSISSEALNIGRGEDRPQPAARAASQHSLHDDTPQVHEPSTPGEVFLPKNTLPRSPSSQRRASVPAIKGLSVQNLSPAPHQAANILPHLNPDPVAPPKGVPDHPSCDSAATSNLTGVRKPAPVSYSLDNQKAYPNEDLPTRDRPILGKMERNNSEPESISPSAARPQNPLEESLSSTIVPAEREDAVGLDMNAFLPAKKDAASSKAAEKLSDDNVISAVKQGFESMRLVLTARRKNLEIVRAMWSSGDIMTAMNTAIRLKDRAILMDLLSVLNLKTSLWSLDLCQVMLPEILDLIASKYESYVATACGALKIVVRNFGQLIKSNVSAPPSSSAVDLSREERYGKCRTCNSCIEQIRAVIEKRILTPGKVGTIFRELNLLLSSTFD